MAVVWPSKNNFANGDVLTAANMNNIADTLNVFNPTSATNGQIWVANGSGSGSYSTFTADSMVSLASGNFPTASGTVTISSISQAYRKLIMYCNDFRVATTNSFIQVRINGSTSAYRQSYIVNSAAGNATAGSNGDAITLSLSLASGFDQQMWFSIDQYTQASYHTVQQLATGRDHSGANSFVEYHVSGTTFTPAAVDSITVFLSTGNWASGSYVLYGVK